jgi:Tetracyclin repressor-like, C-terminal domain
VLRRRIAEWIMAVLAGASGGRERAADMSVQATAHAIVGAGESLANWWLEHPQVRRDEVADWYMGMILAAASAAAGDGHSAGSRDA